MLRKLRRNSKDLPFRPRQDSSTTADPSSQQEPTTPPTPRISFFDLPAELRNTIYESVIADATLTLSTTPTLRPKLSLKKRSKPTTSPPINGLLLASKQCRTEYLSLLLSTIPVAVEIKDFAFETLTRVSASLSPVDLASLRSNRNLHIHLHTRNCTQKSLLHLRAWLDFRLAQPPEQRLPWRYVFPLHRVLPPTTMGKVRLLRELEYYADTIATLELDFEAGDLRSVELREVVCAFEDQAKALEEEVSWLGARSKARSRHVRGLAGGGLM